MARTVTPHPTPNPNAMRFALGESVLGDRGLSFPDAKAARGVPWAERLLALPGVAGLFAMRDFVTVTKAPAADWRTIVPRAVEILSTADLAPGR